MRSARPARPRRALPHLLLRALLVCTGALAGARASAAQAPGAAFSVATWGTEQGLPSNIALNVAQTPDGYLWLASYQGLVRFDGVSFRTFTEADIPGLDRASFWRVATDGAGALWAASETDGLLRYEQGRWSVYRTANGLKSDRVTALLAEDGGVWVGTRSGVSRVRGGRARPLPTPPRGEEPSVTDLAVDRAGTLWIGTVAAGLLRYRAGRYQKVGMPDGLPDGRITALQADTDGSLWVGSYAAGLARIAGDSVRVVAAEGDAAPRRVNDILRDPAGVLWIAADNGLFHLQGERATPVALPGGRTIAQAASLHMDREGSLWVGSRQGGLYRVRPAAVRTLTTADGLPHDLVSAVEGDGADGAWIATQGGVVHLTPRGRRIFGRATGTLPDDIVRDLLRTRDGTLWIAGNGGLTRLQGGRATTYTARDGLADDRARALSEGPDGTLWIATYNGLSALRDGRFRSYGTADGLTDPYILAVHQDRRGRVWLGTQSEGLVRMEGGRFFPGPELLANQPVFRLTEDRDGTLWVGSARGLARIRGDSVFLFTSRHGLAGNAVFQALDDRMGNLWLTGPWGIGRVSRDALDAVAAGRSGSVVMKQFGSRDGMAAHEASSISRAWRAPDGRLWFATPSGAAVVDPGRVGQNRRAPTPILERVVVDGEVHEAPATLVVPPGSRRLEFHFTAPSFVAPEQLRFRFRLDGYDPGWNDAGARRAAHYTNLPPGRYRFRVEVQNEDGVRGTRAAEVALRLRPHPWESAWFYWVAAALLAGLAYAAHRLRLRMAQQALREEMLRDLSLHDDLTGLYNRRGLLALAEQLIRESERERSGFDLVFADLDGLKRINDTMGHPQGDRALRDAGEIIRRTFRESDVVARLSGDEFVVLVRSDAGIPDSLEAVEASCGRLLEAVAEHNAAAGRPFTLALSVGFARFDPAAPLSIDALLEAADQRMYLHKRSKVLPDA